MLNGRAKRLVCPQNVSEETYGLAVVLATVLRKVETFMAQFAAPSERAVSAAPAIANPGPLGLCAFALTTFVLSSVNAGLIPGADKIVIGLALFYGGAVQVLAGMWEFRTGNTFGATAFSSYGAFWLAIGFTIWQGLVPSTTAFGFFLLGWTIFTGLMFFGTLRINMALVIVFALLFLTFLALTIGALGAGAGLIKRAAWRPTRLQALGGNAASPFR
jgi:succinate-acetate transporter protein